MARKEGPPEVIDHTDLLTAAEIGSIKAAAEQNLPDDMVAANREIEEWNRFEEIYVALTKLAAQHGNHAAERAARFAHDIAHHARGFTDRERIAKYDEAIAHLPAEQRKEQLGKFFENTMMTLRYRLEEAARIIAKAGHLLEGTEPTRAEEAVMREALENKRLDRIAEVVKDLNTISDEAHERLLKIIEQSVLNTEDPVDCSIVLEDPAKLRKKVTDWVRGSSEVPEAPSAQYAAAARHIMAELRPGFFRNAGRIDMELKRLLERIEIACATGVTARH